MLAAGISPLVPPPRSTSRRSWPRSRAGAGGFLWLASGLVIATPIVRVVAAAVTFARSGERRMVLVSLAILVVIAIGVLSAVVTDLSA